MRLGNKKLGTVNVELIVFPRGEGEDIIMKMSAITDFEMFNQLVPEPEPPYVKLKDGTDSRDFRDEGYLKAIGEYNTKHVNYMIVKGLDATEDLVWDKVKLEEPDTWEFWVEEMKEAGFTAVELKLVERAMTKANCLDEDYIAEARMRFLQKEAMQQDQES